jgi:hypothetical protein
MSPGFTYINLAVRRGMAGAATATTPPSPPPPARVPFLVDASAVGDKIGIGGCWPVRGESGRLDTTRSPWFSFELNGQPFRAIAALEAVAVLAALVVFVPLLSRNSDVTYAMPAMTDNRGFLPAGFPGSAMQKQTNLRAGTSRSSTRGTAGRWTGCGSRGWSWTGSWTSARSSTRHRARRGPLASSRGTGGSRHHSGRRTSGKSLAPFP